MTNKKIIITIISILLTIVTITTVAVVCVKYWPKSDETKEQKDNKTEGKDQKDQNLKTYQDLENLKNNFDKSYKDADLNNFPDPTEEFKKSQEKFINDFKTKLETFQTEFNKIDKNNNDQINKLYKDYEQTVNECHTEVEKLKKQYQSKDQNLKTYQDLEKLKNDFYNLVDSFNKFDSKFFNLDTHQSKEEFVNEFEIEFNQFEQAFNQINKNDNVKINQLYVQYKPVFDSYLKTLEELKHSNNDYNYLALGLGILLFSNLLDVFFYKKLNKFSMLIFIIQIIMNSIISNIKFTYYINCFVTIIALINVTYSIFKFIFR